MGAKHPKIGYGNDKKAALCEQLNVVHVGLAKGDVPMVIGDLKDKVGPACKEEIKWFLKIRYMLYIQIKYFILRKKNSIGITKKFGVFRIHSKYSILVVTGN